MADNECCFVSKITRGSCAGPDIELMGGAFLSASCFFLFFVYSG